MAPALTARAVRSLLPGLLLSASCVSDTCRSCPSKRLCFLLKITALPNGEQAQNQVHLYSTVRALSAFMCPQRERVRSLGFEYLSHDEDCRHVSSSDHSPSLSISLSNCSGRSKRPLQLSLSQARLLTAPRPELFLPPIFPISGNGKLHYGDASPWSHLTQDENKKPSLSMVCVTPSASLGPSAPVVLPCCFVGPECASVETRLHPLGASTLCDQLCHTSCPVPQQT